jgi:hypothetical protein
MRITPASFARSPAVWAGLMAALLVALAPGPQAASATGPITTAAAIGWLTDLDRLPYLDPGVRTAQFSSYDRGSNSGPGTPGWPANGDSGQYISVNGGEGVMAEMKGPGAIVRIWSANPQGRIKIYLDGETAPTIDMPFAAMFDDSTPPFLSPVCGKQGEGRNMYLPLPYVKSCRVVAVGDGAPPNQYYHIGYKIFPAGTAVETFRLPLSAEADAALARAREVWSHPGADPQAATGEFTTSWSGTIEPGAYHYLPLRGPAAITALEAGVKTAEADRLQDLVLRIHWDGNRVPAVEAPLGAFFGTAPGINAYASLPLGMSPAGPESARLYSYWRMPFRSMAMIVLENRGPRPVSLNLRVTSRLGPVGEAAYFRATSRREAPSHTFDYPFLETTGAGRYCGVEMNVNHRETGWFGEGDEKVWVDGESFPSTFGTGTEDYFGDAWGFHHFVHAVHGNPLGEGPGFSHHWSVYRWQISDDIPFAKSLRVTIENYAEGTDNADYSSTACWYGGK